MDNSEQEVFEFEKKSSFSFSKSWQGFKIALMGTLFVMANDMELSLVMNVIAMVIDFLQMLAFPFNQNSGFPWSDRLTGWLVELCNGIQLEFYISGSNPLQNLILYIIAIFLVFLNLAIICIVGYRFIKKKAQNVFLLKMLRSVTSLLTTVFFMPVLSVFVLIASCSLHRSLNVGGCPADDSKVLFISSVIFSILLCTISLVVCASFYELDYKSDDASARPHARIELIYLMGKMVITVVFKMCEQQEYNLLQIFAILGVGIPMTFLYAIYMPFYNYWISVLQAQLVAIFTWSGICLALALFINNPEDPGPAMLFYVGSVCVWILTKETCDWWRRKLVEKNIYTVNNPYQVELHARFMILERACTYKTEEEKLLTEAEDFYYQAERKFPESSLLKIFVAQFHLTYRDRQEAIPKLEQAERRSPAIDEQFIIYKTRQNVGKDVITMVTFTSYMESSSKMEIVSLSYQLEFWKALTLKSSNNDNQLIFLSKNITKNIDTAANNYKFMLSIDRTHKKMVPMYVYFMEDVLHRVDEEVKNLKNRLRDMIENHNINKIVSSSKLEQQPRISISMEKTTFGRIDKVNPEMISWIKLPKAKLMNQRVDSLMPYYFGQCFVAYLNEIKEKWEEMLGPPPVEMYFIDNDDMLIGCTCNFILESDDSSGKFQGKTVESSINVESRTSSLLPAKSFVSPSQTKNFDNWHRPINCVLVPHEDSEIVIFISSEYLIMNFNSKAAAFFGMNNEMIGVKNIKDYVSNFDGLFERAKKHLDMNSGMLVEFSPVQTFLISNSGTFSRIRISINSYCVDNNIYYILTITEPGSYSKPTQRFFSLFIKFLEVYLKKGGHLGGKNPGILSFDEEDESVRINKLMHRVRKEVESKNSQRSPELDYLSKLMWIFMILMMAAFGGSYAVSVLSFENYVSKINNLDILTDVRAQSASISMYIVMLDLNRQGFDIPDSQETIISYLIETADKALDNIDYISKHSGLDELQDQSLACVSFKYLGGYEIVYYNPVNALIQQATYALKLSRSGISDFNIFNNSYAFWCFFNGKNAIRNSLDDISNKLVSTAEKSRQEIEKWAYTFASIEIALIIAAIFISLPLILKSEELNMKIIRVFYTLPNSILCYLQDITKINLEMRKDKHYPDNRSRYQSAEDLWEEFLITNERKNNRSFTTIQETPTYQVTFCKKFKAFYKNSFTKRLMIYCIISAGISWGLQTYVGVIIPTIKLDSAAMIIKNSGLISAFQSQVSSSLIAEILVATEENSMKEAEDVYKYLNDSSIFVYPNSENTFWDVLNNTDFLRIYFNMLIEGNISLGVDYDNMYSLQISQFINDFIPNACPSYIDDCSYYKYLVSRGYFYAIHSSIIDSEFLAYYIYENRNLSISDRMLKTSSELLPLLKLQYHYINASCYEVEHIIINYYTSIVNTYNFIQEMVLIFYYIFCVSYMILIFRRTLNYHERKKKMTRSMLLLLPQRVVEFSKHIQKALENMDYD
ncbi:hypothetical protein SteCoe_27447 [Stentor coeruleus]|uniref:TmcB/TmcC TPR repeats domain-containing protein n=1 Tax=Stentor coeruleus TaxID=5963 RepID=A0A1R2BAM0_9CILI|nr:hypothetical protein SteCoe_27447 [Stentor coeruleus]